MKQANKNSTQKPGRDDLTGEHPWGDAGQIVFAILFFAVWILDTSFLHYTTFITSQVPWFIRIPAGLLLLFYAIYLARAGLKTVFDEVRPEPRVIQEGVFRRVRHPIYSSELLAYTGLLILHFSAMAFTVWLAAAGFLFFISRYEERLLTERFGEKYRIYMQEVPMLIPRIKVKKKS